MSDVKTIVLLGESGSGKTSLANYLQAIYGYKKIVTYTTRPIRRSEMDGVDYYFVTNEEFEELEEQDFFLESSKYNSWAYGTPKDGFNVRKTVVVLTPSGFRELKKIYKKGIVSVYLRVPRRDRMIMALKRGDSIEELYRRSLSDVGMFDGIENEVDMTIDNEGYNRSIESLAEEVMSKI